MARRKGFSLTELLVAVFIFGTMVASLAVIYATATRHMYQNYRQNVLKTHALIAMRTIQQNLSVATKIDSPGPSAAGSVLSFQVNVDQNTGCYPINTLEPASWHMFCVNGSNLWYHTGAIDGGDGCANNPPSIWLSASPVACGSAGGVLLSANIASASTPFSRQSADGVNELDTLAINLQLFWDAAAAGFSTSQRDIAHSLKTVVKINRAGHTP